MIYSSNEWGDLSQVIVGSATNAHWPKKCKIFRAQEKTTLWKETPLPSGTVPEDIIIEANEDLDYFAKVLSSLGVDVVRPIDLDFQSFDGMYNYCPRDRLLIIGDKVFDAPMLYPTRKNEIEALKHFFNNEIISCNSTDAIFDAANVCRLNNDILFLISESGNYAGAHWLQQQLGSKYKVHILDNIYSGVHIDSTISPVREGLVVLNGDRINEDNLPDVFKSWDKIYITSNDIIPQSFINYPYASKYIALNFLVVSNNQVICDSNQTILREKLYNKGVETIGVDLRHSRTLGGGHHCTTLDLRRN